MHLSSRSDHFSASGGVCDRSRRGSGRHPQSLSTTSSGTAVGQASLTRVVSDRSQAGHRRTVVRRDPTRSRGADGSGRSSDPSVCADTSHHHGVNSGPRSAVNERLFVRLIRWYQMAVDGRPSPCRFTPSCSAYSIEAFEQFGTWRGLSLTIRRLLRCRPFGPSGWDPVPDFFPRKRVDA